MHQLNLVMPFLNNMFSAFSTLCALCRVRVRVRQVSFPQVSRIADVDEGRCSAARDQCVTSVGISAGHSYNLRKVLLSGAPNIILCILPVH